MSAPRRPGGDDRRPPRRDTRPSAPRRAGGDAEGPRAAKPGAKPTGKPRAAKPATTDERVARPARAARAASFRAQGRADEAGERPARPTTRREAKPRDEDSAPRSGERPTRAPRSASAPRDARPARAASFRADETGERPARPTTRREAKPRTENAAPRSGGRPARGDSAPARGGRPARPRRAAPARADKPPRVDAAPRPGARAKEPQRIAKLLARAGIASRREIERFIAEGRVAIDGVVLDTPATLLTSLHGVTFDGQPVQAAAPARLFLFNKPTGFLTTERDPRGRPTIYDRLPKDLPRVMPVGRLDMNTEGLLLLTTDGELKRKLELPSTGLPRVYRARAYGEVSQDQLEALIEGVEIEGIRYGQIDANLERRTGRNVWIEMRLTEGKNREVRRVLEYLGLQVSRLIRVAYGEFILADLAPGGVVEVRQHDLVAFRQTLR